jgi:hypothetical protein
VLVLATIARRLRFRAAPNLGEVAAQPLVTLRPATPVRTIAEPIT